MNYQQAIELALEGNEKGFEFLYQKTYTDKFYVAKKYMKSDAEAEDILQEAYIKAFSKLDTLHKPESFPSWLGQIVANTAKNALAKNNPILFSDMNTEEDKKEQWEDNIEEDKIEKLPEEAYTQKETQEIVQELLDSLSDEQRLCMMMFYLEEQSIKEIAEALECTENTVKSRLNYGRKNVKAKAEAMEKKGYKFYSITPVALLFAFLHTDMEAYAATAVPTTTCANITNKVLGKETVAKGVAKEGIKQGVKQGFLHTVAGKVVVAVAGIAVIGGVATGVAMHHGTTTAGTEVVEEQKDLLAEVEEALKWKEVADEEYPSLLCGGLTKDEFTALLVFGPERISDGQVDMKELDMELMGFLSDFSGKLNFEELGRDDTSAVLMVPKVSIDKYFGIFGNDLFHEGFAGMATKVENGVARVSCASFPYTYRGEITSAKYNDDTMIVEYDVDYIRGVPDDNQKPKRFYKRTATLTKTENGFQVKSIESKEVDPPSWQEQYISILNEKSQSISEGSQDQLANPYIKYNYALLNMDEDDIPELLINREEYGDGICTVYYYDESTKLVEKCMDEMYCNVRSHFYLPAEGKGVIESSIDPFNPVVYWARHEMQNGKIVGVETWTEVFEPDGENITKERALYEKAQLEREGSVVLTADEAKAKISSNEIQWNELTDTKQLKEK